MDIVNPLAQAYAERFTSPQDTLLGDIAASAGQHPQAQMLSGHLQGKFLELISRLMRPDRILEIGTFLGYSALCLSKGLAKAGKLYTIELNEADAAQANENFRKAHALDRIILRRGNALDIIPQLDETWDLVFIDADKPGYWAYYELVFPRLRPGGLIIADNVLFHGEVLEKEIKTKNAIGIHRFNELVAKDGRIEKVVLTVRDGLLLIWKK